MSSLIPKMAFTYSTIAKMAQNQSLIARIMACCATLRIHPTQQGYQIPPPKMLEMATTEGWATAWEKATGQPQQIGDDPMVITDAMILDAVKAAFPAS